MKPKWQKLASLAQKVCTLWFQFYGAFFASKGYPFKNIFKILRQAANVDILFIRGRQNHLPATVWSLKGKTQNKC